MIRFSWPSTLDRVDLPLALSPTEQCGVVLLLTGVAAPLIGLLFQRISGGWETIGKGPLAIEQEPPGRRHRRGPAAQVDPAIQAAEVRQMLEAKANRLRRRGETPLDVEAETTRLLAGADRPPASAAARHDTELRTEVRQIVIGRNERRMRRGEEPLDVEAETERQLADLIGSS